MGDESLNQNDSKVKLLLELDIPLIRVLNDDDQLHEMMQQTITREIGNMMETLGIPNGCEVKIASLGENDRRTGRFLHLVVNNRLCRYSDELLQRVFNYVNNRSLIRIQPDNILALLSEPSGYQPTMSVVKPEYEKLVEFLNLLCLEIIKRTPAVLLDFNQVVAYRNMLAELLHEPHDGTSKQFDDLPVDGAYLLPILKKVINLKISIAEKQTVAKIVADGWAKGRSQDEICEDLVDALHMESLEIQLPREYLWQVMKLNAENGPEAFTNMRKNLFQDLGLRFPTLHFLPNEKLKPNSFACKINHLALLPWIGLSPNQCLVEDSLSLSAQLVAMSIEMINPGTGAKGYLVEEGIARKFDLTRFNQLEYFIACLTANIRENGQCFVHQQAMRNQEELLQRSFPALVNFVRAKVPAIQPIQVFRSLMYEGVSVKCLLLILELLVEYAYDGAIFAEQNNTGDHNSQSRQVSDKMPDVDDRVVTFVRSRMKNQIRQSYAKGMNPLIVYQLDPEVEAFLTARQQLKVSEVIGNLQDEEVYDKIIDEVRFRMMDNYSSSSAASTAILTTNKVRAFLRGIIEAELQSIPVVSVTELPPDTDIRFSEPILLTLK